MPERQEDGGEDTEKLRICEGDVVNFIECVKNSKNILMEGALGERLKREFNLPFLATTPTRRTNRERVEVSGFDSGIIKANVDFLRQIQKEQKGEMYIGGLMGCKGDAYTGIGALNRQESQIFHEWEVSLFAEEKVDFLYVALMPNVEEAAGVALAIQKYRIPYIISFTIRKDGCLIDGTTIQQK